MSGESVVAASEPVVEEPQVLLPRVVWKFNLQRTDNFRSSTSRVRGELGWVVSIAAVVCNECCGRPPRGSGVGH